MFLAMRSPKGGNIISQYLREKKVVKDSFRMDIAQKHEIKEDYWAFRLGYCDECGAHLYVKPSIAKKIYQLLEKKF